MKHHKAYLLIWILLLTPAFLFSQGLLNNGAYISLMGGAYLYINGGAATGNFQNQDNGAFTGTVDNQGTMEITGDWTNLSTGRVFNASTGTVVMSGANQFIKGTSSTWFNHLTLTGSGTKTLNVPTLTGGGFAAPAGLLNLTTVPLDLNSNKLTVNNPLPGAVVNTTGYIISETPAAINPSIVQWNMGAVNGSFVYPFGVSGTLIPFTLNKSAGTGNVSVSTRATASPNNTSWQASVTNMYSAVIAGPGEVPVVIDRWWDVEPSSPLTAALSFTYRGSENTTTFNPTGTFAAQNWNNVQWLPPVGSGPGVLAGTAVVTTTPQVISSTPWVLSNLTAPLPVELLEFTVTCLSNSEKLIEWSTASEHGNQHFTLEKSKDGISYITLAGIPSQGDATNVQHYTYHDSQNASELSFYRLSQTDLNGDQHQFSPVSSRNCGNQQHTVSAWSDHGVIHLAASTSEEKLYHVTLYDSRGRLVWNGSRGFGAAGTSAEIDPGSVSDGIYFLALVNSTELFNYRLFLAK